MEIDRPHESDGSTNGLKDSEMYMVSDSHSGYGLPYAPENFPEPGDKWGWKVGKRVNLSGHYADRYLYLPAHLHEKYKSEHANSFVNKKGFASKTSVERFVMEAFPGTDIEAFFASFTWKIPAGNIEGNKDIIPEHADDIPKFDPAGCKAGNITCPSLLETSDPSHSNVMACDICCIEPYFCRDCCCILCSASVDSTNVDHSFIRCEASMKDGLICGHIGHIECGLRSYMAGTVGGTIGLDAEYYCRRCDNRTDLVPHVKKLLQSCESFSYGDKMQKLNLCVLILRGSSKTSAQTLLNQVQSALGKLKERNSQDIWKWEDASAVTTEVSQCEGDPLEVSNFTEPSQLLIARFDYQKDCMELEQMMEDTLASLKKSQEAEYRIAEEVLMTQKNHLLVLYDELEKEKGQLEKCSPSEDPSLVHAVFKRMEEIKNEFRKIHAMQAVGKGFWRTPKYVLKEYFGVQSDN